MLFKFQLKTKNDNNNFKKKTSFNSTDTKSQCSDFLFKNALMINLLSAKVLSTAVLTGDTVNERSI